MRQKEEEWEGEGEKKGGKEEGGRERVGATNGDVISELGTLLRRASSFSSTPAEK